MKPLGIPEQTLLWATKSSRLFLYLLATWAIAFLWLGKYRATGEPFFVAALHFAIPTSVLAMEFFMLGRIAREARARRAEAEAREGVMRDLNAFRVSIGRVHYMREIEESIRRAEKDVVFTSATMASTASDPEQGKVVAAVLEREAMSKTYTHRGLVADTLKALPGTIELLLKTKIQLKMTSVMEMTRLRFLVRDECFSVIGVSEGKTALDGTRPTQSSFSVESTMLAQSLRVRFDALWANAEDPWKFLDKKIVDAKKSHPRYSKRELLQLLDADRTGINPADLAKNSSEFAALAD